MSSERSAIYLSEIDEERFGIRTARASGVTLHSLAEAMDFCRLNDVKLLIARCLVSELRAAQAMEREGFTLMDTLVYHTRDLLRNRVPPDAGNAIIRPIRPGEEHIVREVAAESFRNYFGHYHADDRLDPVKCDEAYVSWAFRSCISREIADDVLVAIQDNNIGGFFSLRLNSAEEGEPIVGGIRPSMQGKGIYRSFVIRSMEWCLSKGATKLLVSTQITNVAVQKVWARLGFEPSYGFYTFHKWFDMLTR